jgi:LemA protein
MVDARTFRRQSGQVGALAVVVIAIVAVILLIALAFLGIYVSNYNRAIRLDQAASQAWGDVEAQLQRRFDLVGNLVETVKGYATQEKQIFETVAEARTKYFQSEKAGNVEGQIQAANQLSGVLSRLLVLREAYPELKSNQNFLALQDQLEGTENRIAVARTRYNEAAARLNNYVNSFWGRYFAASAGVKERPYFKAAEGAQQAPKVDFSTRTPETPAAPKPAEPNAATVAQPTP